MLAESDDEDMHPLPIASPKEGPKRRNVRAHWSRDRTIRDALLDAVRCAVERPQAYGNDGRSKIYAVDVAAAMLLTLHTSSDVSRTNKSGADQMAAAVLKDIVRKAQVEPVVADDPHPLVGSTSRAPSSEVEYVHTKHVHRGPRNGPMAGERVRNEIGRTRRGSGLLMSVLGARQIARVVDRMLNQAAADAISRPLNAAEMTKWPQHVVR